MSGAQQTCPFCDWYRWQDIPDQMVGDHRDELLEHVARSLQWEWQVHAMELHPKEAAAQDCLTVGAFTSWVTGERETTSVEVETPPGEGGGKTVGVNLPVITPDQAEQLTRAIGDTLATIADNIQNWATQMVPAIRAAADSATAAVRASGCQCESSVIGWHLPGAHGCLYRDETNPLAIDQERWRQRFAGESTTGGCNCQGVADHQRGAVGCIFQTAQRPDSATTAVLNAAATLAPGARGQRFWKGIYGEVPEPDGKDAP